MNPPYANKESNCLDVNFVNKTMQMSDNVVAIFPNYLDNHNTPYLKFFNTKNIRSIDFIESNKTFDISTTWKYVCIYNIDTTKTFDKMLIHIDDKDYTIDNSNKDRQEFVKQINWGPLCDVIDRKQPLYDRLMSQNSSMCHDGHGFVYEENKGGLYGIKKPAQKKLERVKRYLKDGTYKYCLYKGSGNHSYDKVQEWFGQDPDELFNGQCCWLTNSRTVRDNIRYWMECPLFDMWRKYYFNKRNQINCYLYTKVPALDFEMPTADFKQYVDSLNDFTADEIRELKKYNIHNADKL
jgi:hypothetical protein